jgi:Tol biopolymer transport system component/DNA-binding winged helix-turn-helix (wHTH) protein
MGTEYHQVMNSQLSPPRSIDECADQANLRLRIGEHQVDFGALRVVSRPQSARLTSKSASVLLELARHAGKTITRDELLDRVWAGRCTTPDVLTQAIKELRKALADDARPPRYIETIPKVGYRLVAPVLVLADVAHAAFADDGIVVANDDVAAVGAPVVATSAAAPATTSSSHVHAKKWFVAAAAAAVIAIVALVLTARMGAAPGETSAWRATELRVVTSDPGAERRPHISADGTRIAYGRDGRDHDFSRIVTRSITPSDVTELSLGTKAHEAMPVWSPDSSQIAFERLGPDSCAMFVASSSGGAEREVGSCENFAYNYYDWSPDGQSLITAVRPDGDARLALATWNLRTGSKQFITYDRGGASDLEPRYSPDGKWIAFRRGIAPFSDLYVMHANGSKLTQLTHLTSRIRGYSWTRDGRGLIFSSNHGGDFGLYTVEIGSGHVESLKVSPAEYPDAARSADTVVYEIPRTSKKLSEIALSADVAKTSELAPSTGSDSAPAVSPDGNRIAFVSDRSGLQQLWLYDRAKAAATPLTDYHDRVPQSPRWRADGQALVFVVRRKEGAGLSEIDLASRRERAVTKPDENILYGQYGPAADSFIVGVGTSSSPNHLVLIERGGTPQEQRSELATGIEHAELDQQAQAVYYTKSAERGLFRRDLVGGAEQAVTGLLSPLQMDGWRVVDGRIWYLRGFGVSPTELREFDPASGVERTLAHWDIELNDFNFSVTSARDGIVIARVASEDIDVGAFQLHASNGS